MSGDFVYQNPTRINMENGGYGLAQYGSDTNLVVVFYTKSVRDELESQRVGRPIHKNVEFFRQHPPGELLNVIDRPARDDDKQRWPMHYQKFLHNQTQVPEGTPIELLFPNNPAVSDNLKTFSVYTVEQCAALSAHALQTIGMGAQEYQNKAQRYLENAKSGSNFHIIQKELDAQKQENRMLKQQVEIMQKQLNDLIYLKANPNAASLNPNWAPGVDAQTERINANSPTKLAAEEINKKAPKRKVVHTKEEPNSEIDQDLADLPSLEDLGNI